MITQYTAAALLAEMRVLAQPGSIENISTSANQEDFVSFAYTCVRKAYHNAEKLQTIIAIELMLATQALEFHAPLQPSTVTAKISKFIRQAVPTLENDRFIYPDIMYILAHIHSREFLMLTESDMEAALDVQ